MPLHPDRPGRLRRHRRAHDRHTRPRRRRRGGRLPADPGPSRHRPGHRSAGLSLGDRAHRRLHRYPGPARHRGAEVADHRSQLHLRVRRSRRRKAAGRQAAADRDLLRQRRNGRRRVQGGHARRDQHPARTVGGGLRRQPAGHAPVALADLGAPADPRHRPDRRLHADPPGRRPHAGGQRASAPDRPRLLPAPGAIVAGAPGTAPRVCRSAE